jgi:single-strand DNA-binding protein
MSVNNWHGIGNLGKDPELRYTQSGKAVCSFSIAITDKVNGEDRTEWVNIVAWQKLAEICSEYLEKGKKVYIQGRLQTRSYEDRDGNRRYITEVVAYSMEMLSPKSEAKRQEPRHQEPSPQEPSPQEHSHETWGDDDIPF